MNWEVRQSMLWLRRDAIKREMFDLAILYGASAVQLGDEAIEQYIVAAQRRSIDPPISGEI